MINYHSISFHFALIKQEIVEMNERKNRIFKASKFTNEQALNY